MQPGTIPAEWILEARGVSKYFGDFPALVDVTLRFAPGEPVLLYGPNGAGKTTLLRMLASLVQPTEGEILLGGVRADKHPSTCKRGTGFVSHATYLYEGLTVGENLALAAKLFGITGAEKRIAEVLGVFALNDRSRQRVRDLSRGLQQRVTLARALLHDPRFLLLDEPFTGLDAASSAMLESLLRTLGEQDKAVIFSTHSFAQGASIARRLVALGKGRVRYNGPLASAPPEALDIREMIPSV